MSLETGEFHVDLSNCDREPIHIPGAIQPHGALLALSLPALTILQVSESTAHLLGVEVDDVLGRPLEDVVTSASSQRVDAVLRQGSWRDENPLRVTAHDRHYDGIVHEHDGLAILELEPAAPVAGPSHTHRPLLSAIQRADTLDELATLVVDAVKRLTRFERVMLYRFADNGSGSVEAEAKEASFEPYFGLHYPASDIPKQARALYLKNWLRIIPDRTYVPSRLVPARRPDTGGPLDLTFSVLRSVSPIHLQYMANMGVRASMSASLIVGDRLWGQIACVNHSGPLHVSYELRSAIEVLARLVSLQIGALAERDAARMRRGRGATREILARRVRADEGGGVLLSLLASERELLELVAAEGAGVIVGDHVATCGSAPEPAMIRSIASWLEEHAGSAPFATSELPREFSAAVAAKDVASGVLSFALPGQPGHRLLWFRGEVIRTVRWGGDPFKPVEADAGQPLRPRHSFELWKEEVRLSSHRWTASDLEAATDLLRSLVEIDLERQVARERRAARVREDLMAFVSHDLKNPLGVIALNASLIKGGGAGRPPRDVLARVNAASEQILRAVGRMGALISDLLDAAKIEGGQLSVHPRPEPIDDVVSEAITMSRQLAQAKRLELRTDVRDHGLVWVDRARMFQVLSNLLANAIKFTPAGGTVVLGAERRGDDVLFSVMDTGPGIPAADLEHVFDRYWHGSSGGTEGSGLGLWIARGIVEAQGGRIWAESVSGAGARFFVIARSAGHEDHREDHARI